MEFRQILEEKMTVSEGKMTRNEPFQATLDPAHLAFLLGKIEVRRFKKPLKPAPTRRFARSAPRPSGIPHTLNERQKLAVEWFISQGGSLLPDFTAHELKRAYRHLALRLHPDVSGGSSGAFVALTAHHTALKSVLRS